MYELGLYNRLCVKYLKVLVLSPLIWLTEVKDPLTHVPSLIYGLRKRSEKKNQNSTCSLRSRHFGLFQPFWYVLTKTGWHSSAILARTKWNQQLKDRLIANTKCCFCEWRNWPSYKTNEIYLLFAVLNCCLSTSIDRSASFACWRVRSISCCSDDCWEDACSHISFKSRRRTSRSSFSWHSKFQLRWCPSSRKNFSD